MPVCSQTATPSVCSPAVYSKLPEQKLHGDGCGEINPFPGLELDGLSMAIREKGTIHGRYGCDHCNGRKSAQDRLQARAPEMDLIREAQSGSRAAFDALVRQYEHQVLRLALHLTGSEHDAEDIYQEAFLKAYRYIGNFRFECSFYTWIYRIVTNLCLDQLRRKKTRREDHAVLVDHSGDEIDVLASVSDDRSFSNPAKELDRKVLGAKIQSALGKLTPRERVVFELKHYQGLRLRTIGEMLNTTEETAKNTLFRATKKLRMQLAELR